MGKANSTVVNEDGSGTTTLFNIYVIFDANRDSGLFVKQGSELGANDHSYTSSDIKMSKTFDGTTADGEKTGGFTIVPNPNARTLIQSTDFSILIMFSKRDTLF